MIGYKVLRSENLPESLKGKPKWIIYVVFTAGLLIMTLSAIAAGIFIGYTYCYVEHRTGFRTDNITHIQNLKIYNIPLETTEDYMGKNNINSALMLSQLGQKILKIGQTLWDNDPYRPKLVGKKELGHET